VYLPAAQCRGAVVLLHTPQYSTTHILVGDSGGVVHDVLRPAGSLLGSALTAFVAIQLEGGGGRGSLHSRCELFWLPEQKRQGWALLH
jgi:hypothetical protein